MSCISLHAPERQSDETQKEYRLRQRTSRARVREQSHPHGAPAASRGSITQVIARFGRMPNFINLFGDRPN